MAKVDVQQALKPQGHHVRRSRNPVGAATMGLAAPQFAGPIVTSL